MLSAKLKVFCSGDVGGELHVIADTKGDCDELSKVHGLEGHGMIEEPGRDDEVIQDLNIAQDGPRAQTNLERWSTILF